MSNACSIRTRLVSLAGLCVAIVVAGKAGAQDVSPLFTGDPLTLRQTERFEAIRDIEQSRRLIDRSAVGPGQRVLIDYGGYVTGSYLTLDDAAGDNRVLRQGDVVGYLRLNWDDAHEVFVRGSTGYRDFREGDSFDGRGDDRIDPDLDRAYYRFDLSAFNLAYRDGLAMPLDVTFQGGRDFVYWANGLVLARTLDGVRLDVGGERLGVGLVAGVTPPRTIDFDVSRPRFDHNTRRGFYGLTLGGDVTVGDTTHRPFVYGLIQRDYNDDEPLAFGPIETAFGYDSEYVGIGSVGTFGDRLRYGVEFAWQFGRTLSNSFELTGFGGLIPVAQTEDRIRAYGLDVTLDYLLPDPNQSRLSAEFILASGDDDRGTTNATFNGNTPGTTDRAFNAFGLLNTGLAFSPEVSNLLAVRLGASTFPFAAHHAGDTLGRLQIGADLFVYARADRRAPIDEPTFGGERFLGVEPDLYLNWQVTSDVTLALRYGLFIPNDQAFAIDDPRHFFYGGLTFAF